jgi:LCP family protein required for cell wall assembly
MRLKLFFKALFLSFSLFILFAVCFIVSAFFVVKKYSRQIDRSPNYLLTTAYKSWKNNKFTNSSQFNFIILGLDKRDDWLEKTNTTDTIIFSSLNFKTNELNLISLPRDIWHYETATKINGIYELSLKDSDSFKYIQENFSKLTGQNIDKTIVITTESLINLVKEIGGVDVYLEKGFKDTKYPNPEYIKNPSPKTPIYKTVEFPAGNVHLDETNVTEFVRSRKSAESAAEGGTDIGRIKRQQLLIDSLITKIRSDNFLSDPENIVKLYNFWQTQITTNFTDEDFFSLALTFKSKYKNLSLKKIDLPIGNTADEGVIYHPEKFINKQWVFTTKDKDYRQLRDFIRDSLN